MKSNDLDISVFQKYICAVEMRVAVNILRKKKSAEKFD